MKTTAGLMFVGVMMKNAKCFLIPMLIDRNNLIKISEGLTVLFLFLVSWQTRLILKQGMLNGGEWEYGTISIYAAEIILWLAFVFQLISVKARKHESTKARKQMLWAGAAVVAWIFFTIAWAPEKAVSFFSAFRLLEAVLLVWLIQKSNLSHKILSGAFVAGASIQALLGLWQVMSQKVFSSTMLGIANQLPQTLGVSVVEVFGDRFLRAYGGLPHPNILGGYLVLGILLLTVLFIKGKISVYLFSVLEILISACLFFTFSRSAWLGLLVGLICLAIVKIKRGNGECKKKFFLSAIIIALVFAIFGLIFHQALSNRLTGNSRLENTSQTERLSGLKQSFGLIKNNLFFGVGIGNYTSALAQTNPNKPAWFYQPAHNVFLLALLEIGLIGFVLLALAILFFFKNFSLFPYPLPYTIYPFIIISLFDHYFWSLYVGVMLAAIAVGFWLKTPEK